MMYYKLELILPDIRTMTQPIDFARMLITYGMTLPEAHRSLTQLVDTGKTQVDIIDTKHIFHDLKTWGIQVNIIQ